MHDGLGYQGPPPRARDLPPMPPSLPPKSGGNFFPILLVLGSLCALMFLIIVLVVIADGGTLFHTGPRIALLEIRDVIYDEQPILEDLQYLIDEYDPEVIVMRVDSPGGVITVVEEIYKALARTRDKGIPIVASMGTAAASGGYFVCLGADHVFANESTLTGSIGVLMEYMNAKDLFDKVGVEYRNIGSGEYKGLGSLGEHLTEAQEKHLKDIIGEYHKYFVDLVREERNLPLSDVEAIADGRMITGAQAVDLGLVDDIGDLYAAIQYAASLIDPEYQGEPEVFRVHKDTGLLGALFGEVQTRAQRLLPRVGYVPKFVMQ